MTSTGTTTGTGVTGTGATGSGILREVREARHEIRDLRSEGMERVKKFCSEQKEEVKKLDKKGSKEDKKEVIEKRKANMEACKQARKEMKEEIKQKAKDIKHALSENTRNMLNAKLDAVPADKKVALYQKLLTKIDTLLAQPRTDRVKEMLQEMKAIVQARLEAVQAGVSEQDIVNEVLAD